jgi:hypothetical protein
MKATGMNERFWLKDFKQNINPSYPSSENKKDTNEK